MSFFVSAAAFLVAIGILVAVHEYGHFIAARMLGVRVLRFSIGFGRPLWSRRSGPDETEYCVSAIPFGGYVKLLDERDSPVTLAEQHRAFNRQPIPSRVAILAAGPVLNFLFAIVAYWAMFLLGVDGTRPVVGVVAPDTIASRAGLERGDDIVAVGGQTVSTLETAVVLILDHMLDSGRIALVVRRADGSRHDLVLDTEGRAASLTEPGQLFDGLGFAPWMPEPPPDAPPVIGELAPGGTAVEAGLRAGDRIVRADGTVIATWMQWVEYVRERPGRTITIDVLREGRQFSQSLPIARVEADGRTIGRIGAGPEIPAAEYEKMRATERYPAPAALREALARTWEMSSLTLRMIGRMVTGDVSVKNISGPINIAQYAGYSASIGLTSFLSFLAIVSISLGILNLLPVPMLDGGQIAYQLAEAAKGSPLSERSQMIGQQVGIFLLLVLMSFAFYNDISRLLG